MIGRVVWSGALVVMATLTAQAGTPKPSKFPVPPSTQATITAQQAAIRGAYVAPAKFAARELPTFPVPVYPEDTQSPGVELEPASIQTPLVREWAIMGPDDGSGLLAGPRETLLRRLGRVLLTLALVGGAGYWVFRRVQKHLDATLRGWGLNVD